MLRECDAVGRNRQFNCHRPSHRGKSRCATFVEHFEGVAYTGAVDLILSYADALWHSRLKPLRLARATLD
jgi:hypothetical protein